jgi:hypothetical protein
VPRACCSTWPARPAGDGGRQVGSKPRADILRAVVARRRWTSGPEFTD